MTNNLKMLIEYKQVLIGAASKFCKLEEAEDYYSALVYKELLGNFPHINFISYFKQAIVNMVRSYSFVKSETSSYFIVSDIPRGSVELEEIAQVDHVYDTQIDQLEQNVKKLSKKQQESVHYFLQSFKKRDGKTKQSGYNTRKHHLWIAKHKLREMGLDYE